MNTDTAAPPAAAPGVPPSPPTFTPAILLPPAFQAAVTSGDLSSVVAGFRAATEGASGASVPGSGSGVEGVEACLAGVDAVIVLVALEMIALARAGRRLAAGKLAFLARRNDILKPHAQRVAQALQDIIGC